VRASLYVQATINAAAARRRPGQAIPRSAKLLQGALLFLALLTVLWLPLLAFSSGAPTYVTPEVASVRLNVSLISAPVAPGGGDGGDGFRPVLAFWLFGAGERRAERPVGPAEGLPAALAAAYGRASLQCMAPVRFTGGGRGAAL